MFRALIAAVLSFACFASQPALSQAEAPISATEWAALAKGAKPGGVIDLGTRRVTFARIRGLSDVTIRGGVFGFTILDTWKNVTFENTRFEAALEDRVMTGASPPYIDAYSPEGLTIRNATFVGYTNAAGQLAANSLRIRGGNNVVVTRSTFRDLANFAGFIRTTNLRVTDNRFSYIREGVQLVGVTRAVVARNSFGPFRPAPGDHADGVQLFTNGLTLADDHGARDVLIEDNFIDPGAGYRAQGIFMRDELGFHKQGRGYANITVRNNLLIGTGWHGIAADRTENLLIEGNRLLIRRGPDGVTDNWIRVALGAGIVRNNYAGSIQLGPDMTASGNTSVKRAATDAEITAAKAAFAARLARAAAPARASANRGGGNRRFFANNRDVIARHETARWLPELDNRHCYNPR